MTDNEIIKALVCCTPTYEKVCGKCIYREYKSHGISEKQCSEYMREDLFDLIYRQKAEIERLKKPTSASAIQILAEQAVNSVDRTPQFISEIKADAIKEFVEKLCEDRVSNDPIVIAAKCLLKEMVGNNDAENT